MWSAVFWLSQSCSGILQLLINSQLLFEVQHLLKKKGKRSTVEYGKTQNRRSSRSKIASPFAVAGFSHKLHTKCETEVNGVKAEPYLPNLQHWNSFTWTSERLETYRNSTRSALSWQKTATSWGAKWAVWRLQRREWLSLKTFSKVKR